MKHLIIIVQCNDERDLDKPAEEIANDYLTAFGEYDIGGSSENTIQFASWFSINE